MRKAHIFIAEDDKNIQNGLIDTLESEGYKVTAESNGTEAVAQLNTGGFDLALLDIMMPGKSGYDVCREIRKREIDIPVIMLTAKTEEIDKVVGLKLGADDYVTKPFGLHELLARIEALLRRCEKRRADSKVSRKARKVDRFDFGGVSVDVREYKIRDGRTEYPLTHRELDLLFFFKEHPNEVLSRDELLNRVWGIEYYGTTRTLDQHIAKLRKKVSGGKKSRNCIETIHGVGYRYIGG